MAVYRDGDELENAVDDNGRCLVVYNSNGTIFDHQCGKVSLNITATTGGRVNS